MRRKIKCAAVSAGSLLALTAMMTAPVYAGTNGGSISAIDTEAWTDRAAANVDTYANVREEASEDSRQTGVLLPGCSADVTGTEGEWTKIRSGSVEGFVRSDLLVFGEEARVHYRNVHGFEGTVTASALNVRSAPSLSGKVLGQEPEEETVKITGEEDGWYQVEYQNGEAYVCADYVEVKDPDQTALTPEEYQEKKEAEASAAAAGQTAAGGQRAALGSGELDLLAAIIHCEAGGESRTGKVAVGAVVLNRVNSSAFPDTVTEVVYQSGQFTPASSGALANALASGVDEDCYEAARAALNGENPVGGCLYFNSGYGKGIQIGNQHFY